MTHPIILVTGLSTIFNAPPGATAAAPLAAVSRPTASALWMVTYAMEKMVDQKPQLLDTIPPLSSTGFAPCSH
jgi:hypothetical protein